MLVILLVTVAFGVSYNQDDMFLKTFTNEFDTTINIISSPARTQNNRTKLQELAQKHNMSFIKVRRIPRNQRNERQQISIFVYLNDAAWFEKTFPNISFQKNIHGTNEFKNAKGATFLTSKEVSLLPFSKNNSNNFNGDYYFHGTKEDTEAFLKELTGNESLGIQATVDSSVAVASDTTENQLFLYLTILAIMVAAILFCYAIYNGRLTKEVAVAGLIGWQSSHFAAAKAARLVLPPLLIAVPIISGALMYVTQPQTVRGFLAATKIVYLAAWEAATFFFVLEFIIIVRKFKRQSIAPALKGKRPNREKTSTGMKIVICAGTLLMAAIAIAGFQDFKEVERHMPEWRKSANYVNISCGWPWTYVEDDDKFNEVVVPKLNRLWNELDREGAILFFAPNAEKEGVPVEFDAAEPFGGRYAYVNKNYMEFASPAAPDGKKPDIPTLRDDEWLILYPEKNKPTKDDIEKIKETQRDEWSKKKAPAVKLMPIKVGQSFMTCDSSMRLEEAWLQDYTLILVDGGRLKPTGSIKLPSLVNGYFHPHVKNSANAYDELKSTITHAQADPYVLWISSVYDDVMFQIEEIRTEAAVNAIAFMLLLLIIAFVVKIDVESYLYHHGRRLDVSYLLGYGFVSVHGKRLLKSGIGYGISLGLFIGMLKAYPKMNFLSLYAPRGGWTTGQTEIAVMAGVAVLSICFIGEIIKLGRDKKNIGERLKEGC